VAEPTTNPTCTTTRDVFGRGERCLREKREKRFRMEKWHD
jgi:hypothetical protein